MLKTKINTILLCTLFTLFFPLSAGAQYRNPILYADVPDMSVCRAGDYFYMVSTTMHLMPGAPIMRSPDMKHWETISYVFPRIDDAVICSYKNSCNCNNRILNGILFCNIVNNACFLR